jgi:hypothetical protein
MHFSVSAENIFLGHWGPEMKARLVLSFGVALLSLGLASTSAHALSLSPGSELGGLTFTNSNCNAACVSVKVGINVTELYKMNVGDPEEGSLAGSYTTTFQNSATDPSGFILTYSQGSAFPVCPTCYLLVKDGNHAPYQYLFNLESWNGIETITGTGFWPNQGAISHVAIYGTRTSVPEPSALLLLGIGLAGVGIWRWKVAKT